MNRRDFDAHQRRARGDDLNAARGILNAVAIVLAVGGFVGSVYVLGSVLAGVAPW